DPPVAQGAAAVAVGVGRRPAEQVFAERGQQQGEDEGGGADADDPADRLAREAALQLRGCLRSTIHEALRRRWRTLSRLVRYSSGPTGTPPKSEISTVRTSPAKASRASL